MPAPARTATVGRRGGEPLPQQPDGGGAVEPADRHARDARPCGHAVPGCERGAHVADGDEGEDSARTSTTGGPSS